MISKIYAIFGEKGARDMFEAMLERVKAETLTREQRRKEAGKSKKLPTFSFLHERELRLPRLFEHRIQGILPRFDPLRIMLHHNARTVAEDRCDLFDGGTFGEKIGR